MRPLRDRLAEALRRCRVGNTMPHYLDLPEHTREDYRKSADMLVSIGAAELDFTVSDEREDRA
jgi:hypothetical protein